MIQVKFLGDFHDVMNRHAERIAQAMLAEDCGYRHLLISPVLWDVHPHASVASWSIILAADCPDEDDVDDEPCFALSGIQFEDEDAATAGRAALLAEFQARVPDSVHAFEDDLDMAREVERLWPSARASLIRSAVEARRRSVN